jgi:hypothetical protein
MLAFGDISLLLGLPTAILLDSVLLELMTVHQSTNKPAFSIFSTLELLIMGEIMKDFENRVIFGYFLRITA